MNQGLMMVSGFIETNLAGFSHNFGNELEMDQPASGTMVVLIVACALENRAGVSNVPPQGL